MKFISLILLIFASAAYAGECGPQLHQNSVAVLPAKAHEGTLRAVRETLILLYKNGEDLTSQLERELKKVTNAMNAGNLNFRAALNANVQGNTVSDCVVGIAFSAWQPKIRQFDEKSVVYLRVWHIDRLEDGRGRLRESTESVELIDPEKAPREIEAQVRAIVNPYQETGGHLLH